jgi:maltose alpha-D-glucosyltransferase/alpha-amylase
VGTLRDFKQFLRDAHERGLRVVTELVLAHTSDQHPWFQRARRARKGSRLRDYYVWSDDPSRFSDAAVIFTDYESSNFTWDPVAGQYFFTASSRTSRAQLPEHGGQAGHHPDRRLLAEARRGRPPARRRPVLYQRDGTTCENLPETHEFIREVRRHVDAHFPGRMLLAEANQCPRTRRLLRQGDECHMAFHFPIIRVCTWRSAWRIISPSSTSWRRRRRSRRARSGRSSSATTTS